MPEKSPADQEQHTHGPYAHPVLHVLAPFIVIAADVALRRLLSSGYRSLAGSPAPDASDRSVSWRRAVAWTAATSAATAVVEVAIIRLASRPRP